MKGKIKREKDGWNEKKEERERMRERERERALGYQR